MIVVSADTDEAAPRTHSGKRKATSLLSLRLDGGILLDIREVLLHVKRERVRVEKD